MLNYYYRDSITDFCNKKSSEIIGEITIANQFDSNHSQNKSWEEQIKILKSALTEINGTIYFEFTIPRMGKRVDVLLIISNIVFVIEFKVGESKFYQYHIDQVWDYSLDLKNFHEPSHSAIMVPILVATESKQSRISLVNSIHNDNVLNPILSNSCDLNLAIEKVLKDFQNENSIESAKYEEGSYKPTPTIIEAAISLFNNHSVEEIVRRDASAKNLSSTSGLISRIIHDAKEQNEKVICFVTGVPGAGKTLVGLKIATEQLDESKNSRSVYLSGNAPLVAILQEALTRDKVKREARVKRKITRAEAKKAVKAFIQIIHHYRDAYLVDKTAPFDHVAIFDEAQRAWNKDQTVKFMRQKKNQHDFDFSESEFLISCLDRHKDWAVIICLVGGGQEINTGEGGISEWLIAIKDHFPNWIINISPSLIDSEYGATNIIEDLKNQNRIKFDENLHLAVSMRSFRAELVSHFVKKLLDIQIQSARELFEKFHLKYPIFLTRSLDKAKTWLKKMARASERYGIVVSSQAQRLKPYAIDVTSPVDPVKWFLNDKDDIRSSYFLEDVATEFKVQGLEIDWVCVAWDGDLRFNRNKWETFSFSGNKWQNINKAERKQYLINAYRVLLTRARQGMIIVVPEGNLSDHTRKSEYYDPTFEYLKSVGLHII